MLASLREPAEEELFELPDLPAVCVPPVWFPLAVPWPVEELFLWFEASSFEQPQNAFIVDVQ